jgi:hypothetical protein
LSIRRTIFFVEPDISLAKHTDIGDLGRSIGKGQSI